MNDQWKAIPAVKFKPFEAVLYRSWAKKAWDHTRKFVKKHKTEIIIAAVVAAGVITVAIVAGAAAGGAVAGGVAGAVAANSGENDSCQQNYPGLYYDLDKQQMTADSEPQVIIPETPTFIQDIHLDPVVLQDIVQSSVESFKEENVFVPEVRYELSTNPTFLDRARELGAHLAHEALDEISNYIEIVPEALHGFGELGKAITGFEVSDSELTHDPLETHKKLFAAGHQKIDELFSTNQAHLYEPSDESSLLQISYGALPPPGSLGRIPPSQAIPVKGWKAGQIESMELHHTPIPQREGGLFEFIELWPDEHAQADNLRKLGQG